MSYKKMFFSILRNVSLSLNESSLKYDRKRIKPGILHFGVGQFCRGHLFYYTQQLFEISAKEKHQYDNWGIVGVNVLKGKRERAMLKHYKKQKCIYSFTMFSPKGEHKTLIIGSMIDYVCAEKNKKEILQYLVNPQIKIVSLTVTEGGYYIDEATGTFDLTSKHIKIDLANPKSPHTAFGFIVEGLRLRRESKMEPFTIMSCDNLRSNGDVAKLSVTSYAKAIDSSLASWIEKNVSFPNSMVDRITPATTSEMRDRLNKLTGLNDRQPVVGEDFSQWVMENKFRSRPEWERVGLEITDNVAGFEHTKVRILNSSHLMLCYPGLLLGYRTVHEALGDADVYKLVENSLSENVLPTLESPMDKEKYKNTVLSRFKNPAIADQLTRIFGDGCSKIQVFWADNVMAILKKKLDVKNFAFGLACFIECLKGKDGNGQSFEIFEPKLDENWKKLIEDKDLSAPLALNAFDAWRKLDHKKLDEAIVKYRKLIQEKGCRDAMPFKNY